MSKKIFDALKELESKLETIPSDELADLIDQSEISEKISEQYKEIEHITLTASDYDLFVDSINNPEPPNENLKLAFAKYKEMMANTDEEE